MLKKILSKNDSVIKAYKKYRKQSIDHFSFLLEAGQGKNINGNMFALAKELCENPRWKNYKVYWIVVDETLAEAKERFKTYGYSVQFINRNSKQYGALLAKAKFLLTDNSFPPFFSKREGQIYLNTWHGTPLKTLGKSDIKNATSLANIQKNYLMADYALFPNKLTKNVFMKDYMLEYTFKGKILMCDYPRNTALFDENLQQMIKEKYGLEDKQLIAYMPTWRGSNRTADAQIQKDILSHYFDEIDNLLSDNQIFYVNLHFLVGNIIDYSNYKHIRPFPSEYETYDFLGVCDTLVTDYSSVFFDFARKDKNIILFAYDLEEYMEERGTYFSIYDLPFPIVRTAKELVDEINQNDQIDMKAFLKKYCYFRQDNIPEKIIDLLVNEQTSELNLEENSVEKKPLVLIYAGDLKNKFENHYLLEHIQQLAAKYIEKNVLVCFRGKINDDKIDFLNALPENVEYQALVSKFNFNIIERIILLISSRNKLVDKIFNKHVADVYKNEKERFFPTMTPDLLINLSNKFQYIQQILGSFDCHKILYLVPKHFLGLETSSKKYANLLSYLQSTYDEVFDDQMREIHQYWNEDKDIYYNNQFQLANIKNHFSNSASSINISSIAILRTNCHFSYDQVMVEISGYTYTAHLRRIIRFSKTCQLVKYHIQIPISDVERFEIQNKVNFIYQDQNNYGFKKGTKYNLFHLKKGKNKQGSIKILEQNDTSAYFRQSANNILYFTVRKRNLTDTKQEQLKLNLAYWLAKITPMKKKIVLLYEKEASRYEESASVLYEKLLDLGYTNAYFILDKQYPYRNQIQEKYRNNLISKGSFKHYYYFFKSKTFLGSEALVHVIDLRISNKHALDKINSKDINYVFLQHGVMYMVSLDSESRRFFKPMKTNGKYRVVTSSVAEAKHFIELGKYNPEFIYICGLPKFDRNTWNPDADKIVIMPTWRPWEYNEARYDFVETKYYAMIHRIFSVIPDHLKEKVIILPHPLFYDAVKESEFELKKYLNVDRKYDDILKETKILITDYSSIAYDAFYRGCNVIFYWEEKDECLENYGPSTKLMLNEDNAYGDICYSSNDLKKVIDKNYDYPQDSEYVNRYQELVNYHDGKNTERLVDLLRKDEII